jgi:hypothetical protein
MRNLVLVGLACLVVGGAIGFFVGRAMLEREWSQPAVLKRLSAADVQRSKSGKDAAVIPKEGALVLGRAPLSRARMVVAELTRQDPVVLEVGDVGNGDDGLVLNLDLKNRGKCAVTALSGTAYGYDAYGKPAPMNLGGEHYVAFEEDEIEGLTPNAVHGLSVNLHHAQAASLAVAHVDRVTCADGTQWARN